MNDMTPIAPVGHNNPPVDPIDAVIAEHEAVITEAQNWTDGKPVTDEASMKAVDNLIKGMKSYRSDLAKAGKERTDPLHKAWKAEVAAVKVYSDDADLIQKALIALVAPFKAQLAKEKEAAQRDAWEAANKARREAEAKAAQANEADLESQREAAAAQQVALEADKAARTQLKDTVKGLRKTDMHEVISTSALLRWMNEHARAELDACAAEFARKNHKIIPNEIVNSWVEDRAF